VECGVYENEIAKITIYANLENHASSLFFFAKLKKPEINLCGSTQLFFFHINYDYTLRKKG